MLLTEFFNNPMGKGSAALNINATKEKFDQRYDTFYKDISHTTFFIKNDIYISVNIPSSVRGIFYDVVIKFTPNDKSAGVSVTDMDYKFFSNSPSFLYTYANAYSKKKLLIRELDRKLSREMIKEIAKTRNPYSIISYDYTIYCALKYILSNGFDKISALKLESNKKSTMNDLYKSVQDWETLQKKRKLQKISNKLEDEEKLKENQNQEITDEGENDNDSNSKAKRSPKTKKVKNTKTVAKTKKVKKVKKI